MARKSFGTKEKEHPRVEAAPVVLKKGKKPFLWVMFFLLVIGALSVAGYFYYQYQDSQNLLKDPKQSEQREAQQLVDKIGTLIELPTDEFPTIATVSDITKLSGQPFFAKAKNGDKALFYSKAKKAILYDPLRNKILEVGPFNPDQPTPSVSTVQSLPVTVAIYNGTKTVGLASSIEKELQAQVNDLTVIEKDNAKSNYSKTMVVDLTGKQQAAAAHLATLLSGEVGSLPREETKAASSSADILILLGK